MRKTSPRLILLTFFIFSLVTVFPAAAETVTINFDNLPSLTFLTNQYQDKGVIFQTGNVQVWASNSVYPPHSAPNVVLPYRSKEIRIDFTSPVSNVGLYYSSYHSVNLKAYKKPNTLIGQVSGSRNIPPSGNGRSDPLTLSGVDGIDYITVGYSGTTLQELTIDDLSFTTTTTPIPEFPSVAVPVAGVIGLLFIFGRKKAGM